MSSRQTNRLRLGFHLQEAKKNGITRTEIAEIITHIAFYAGWPKAWAASRQAKEVWAEEISADEHVPIANVTFEPGCHNNWHIHHPPKAVVKCLLVLPDEAGIRSGESLRRRFSRELSSTSRQV